jgi:hypothetical protein
MRHGALGSPVAVAPVNDELGLAIAEGIEDGLSIHLATGLGSWAAGGATRMPTLAVAVPKYCECVTVIGDDNATGRKNAGELAARLRARGDHWSWPWLSCLTLTRSCASKAVLTILRAYHVAGRPKRPPRLQSFAEWSDTARGALIWLGAGDPVKTMERLRKSDPVLRSLKMIMHAWKAAFDGRAVAAREAIEAANEMPAEPVGDPTFIRPGLRDALMTVAGRRGVLDARSLGNWLGRHAADRVINLSDNGREEYASTTTGPISIPTRAASVRRPNCAFLRLRSAMPR